RARGDAARGPLPRRPVEEYAVRPVGLLESDRDILLARGGDVLAHVVGPDRQFPVPTVDQHGQLDACRSTEVAQRVEGRPDRAAGEQDIVHEDDRRVVETFGGYPGGVHRPVWPAGQVVAVEGDVE